MKIVINADDFGLLPEVNRAIVDAFHAGGVTAATLFASAPATEDALDRIASCPSLDLGLHFNLTFGRPTSDPADVPSLVDKDGCFLTRKRLILRITTGRLRSDDVRHELNEQLARLDHLGGQLSHIDGHQHIQVLPVVSKVLATEAEQRGLPVRIPVDRFAALDLRPQKLALRGLSRRARREGLTPATESFASIFDLRDGSTPSASAYQALISKRVSQCCESLELMVHPAHPSTDLQRIHPDIYKTAVAEGSLLVDPGFALDITRHGHELTSFRKLRKNP